jgi:hypothetical protein
VLVHGPDGRVEHSLIGANGTYIIADAPLGEVRITVHAHPAAPPGLPTRGVKPPAPPPELPAPSNKDRPTGEHVTIPPRYADPDRSGITYLTRAGAHKRDIDLQP